MTISNSVHLEAGDRPRLEHFRFTSAGKEFSSLSLTFRQVDKISKVDTTVFATGGTVPMELIGEDTVRWLLSLVSKGELAREIQRRERKED